MTRDKRGVLEEKLSVFIRPMCMDFLRQSEKEPLDFMIEWLNTNGRQI